MNTHSNKSIFIFYYSLLLVFVLALSVWLHTLDREQATGMLHEDGAIEIITVVGYGLCLLLMLSLGGKTFVKHHFPLMAVVALLAMRELDFDKRFTETGMLQSRIFTRGDVILHERIAGIVVVVSILILIAILLRYYLKPFLQHLWRFNPVSLGIALAIGLAVVAKSIDGLGRKLEPFGITVSADQAFTAASVEEVMELGIPVALMLATWAFLTKQQPRQDR